MPEDVREAESTLFEVVLYFENKSWAFSTCAYSTHFEAALELAEKDFYVHALHHNLGAIKADFACVLDSADDRYFSKRNGRWEIESDRFERDPHGRNRRHSQPRLGGLGKLREAAQGLSR
ncbi:MAG: hypothetical protein WAN43_10990 [Rhodomicrobium sp.]